MKHKIGNVLLWILSVFFLMAFITYLPSVASVLFLIIGIGIMPIKIIKNLWDKIPLKQKFVKPLFIIILFFVAVVISPDQSGSTQSEIAVEENSSNIETETTEEITSETDASETATKEINVPNTTEVISETEISTAVTEEKSETPQTDAGTTVSPEIDDAKDTSSGTEQPLQTASEPTTAQAVPEPEQPSQAVLEPTTVQPAPEPEPEQQLASETGTQFAVNGKNGKIHIVGACTATGNGDGAMTKPVYFNTYEEAEAHSIQIAPNQNKRRCGNCWK